MFTLRPFLLRQALLVLMLCLAGVAAVRAAEPATATSVERGVKAAFLYKFLGYVEFAPNVPQDAGSPLVVGVLGADDIAAELSRVVTGRNVNGHPVAVKVLHEGDSLNGIHLLFVSAGETARAAAMLKAAQQAGVLSVTEASNLAQAGSVINFRQVEDRIRFEVSLDAAERSNIKLSSRLLSVAYAVLKSGGS